MNAKLLKLYEKIKANGLTPEQEQKILLELHAEGGTHDIAAPASQTDTGSVGYAPKNIYAYNDLFALQAISALQSTYNTSLRSVDELLERDKLREKDGFPRKIRVGRLIKPGKGGKDKVVIVPSTVEEKLIHDTSFKAQTEDEPSGGTGDGEEGEVIGEQPVRPDTQGETGPGQ